MARNIEEEINAFITYFTLERLQGFLLDVIPIIELYNVEEDDDWVENSVGKDDVQNVRLIRTVYLMSRIAEFHAGMLSTMKVRYRDLWKRMEKHLE